MKRFIGLLVGLGLLVGVIAGGAKLATQHQSGELAAVVDQLNPLVPTQTIYVKTTQPRQYDHFGTPTYQQTAVDAHGHQRPIMFTGMKTFALGHYLALTTKGAYVKTYTEVAVHNLPTAAQQALN